MTVKSYRKNKLNSKYAQADKKSTRQNSFDKKKAKRGLPSLGLSVKP